MRIMEEEEVPDCGLEDENEEPDTKDYSKTPITVTMRFEIHTFKKNDVFDIHDGLRYDGKAGPGVSSGCWFGAGLHEYYNGLIERIINETKDWYRKSYHREVIVKHTVVDSRKKQITLEAF